MSWGDKIGPSGPQRSIDSEGGGGANKRPRAEYTKEALEDIESIRNIIRDNDFAKKSYPIRELSQQLQVRSAKGVAINEDLFKDAKIDLLEISVDKLNFALDRKALAISLRDPKEGFSPESNRRVMSAVKDGSVEPHNPIKTSEAAFLRANKEGEAAAEAVSLLNKLRDNYKNLVTPSRKKHHGGIE